MAEEEVVAAALSDPDAQPVAAEQLACMRRVSRVAPTAASSAALRRLTIAINAQSLGGGDELPAPRDR